MSKASVRDAAIIGLVLTSFVAGAARADDRAPKTASEDAQTAEDFASAAAQAVEQNDLERARKLFRESMRLKPTYDTTGNLGAVELALKQYRDCATHLTLSLRDYPPTASEASKKATVEKLGECQSHVGAARLEVHPNGVKVMLDGEPAGVAPLTEPMFLEPGHHSLQFKHEGYGSAERTVTASAGTESRIKLTLQALPDAKSGSDGAALLWPVLGGGIGSAVLFGAGVAAYLVSASKETDGDALKTDLAAAGKACPGDCAALIETYDSASAARNAATGLFVTTGLAVTGTVAYYMLFRQTPEHQKTAWLPVIDTHHAGLWVRSEF